VYFISDPFILLGLITMMASNSLILLPSFEVYSGKGLIGKGGGGSEFRSGTFSTLQRLLEGLIRHPVRPIKCTYLIIRPATELDHVIGAYPFNK
jgi:hypothetical protein